MPMLLPALRIEMLVQEFSINTAETDTSFHSLDTLNLDLSKLKLPQIYFIQHVAATEVRIRENTVAYQEAKAAKKANKCKQVIK